MDVRDWLGEDNQLGIDIWEKKYRHQDESFDEWLDRVSGGDAELRQLITEKKFLFGGRVLANRGIEGSGNFFNCFDPTTKILTKKGIKTLRECLDEDIEVLTINRTWQPATVKSFGVQEVVELHLTKNGLKKVFTVTKDHIWFGKTEKNRKKDTYEEFKTIDLIKGTRLCPSVFTAKDICKPSPFGVAHGIFYGDGAKNNHRLTLCGDKKELLPYFTPIDIVQHNNGDINIGGMPEFFNLPPNIDETSSYLYGWLAGYFAADGCVDEKGTCVMSSTNEENLKIYQDICCRLGIHTNPIRLQHRISNLTHEPSDLYVMTLERKSLKENFFIRNSHKERFLATPITKKQDYWIVDHIEDKKQKMEVMCVVEPQSHTFALEGNILTHNCFSAGFVPDDYAGIMDMLKEIGITFKHQGGQGISLTKLRPKGTPIGTEHESDGIIPFMEMFNSVTQGTSQGGARKGALMISLDINHKEAKQFIKLKSDLNAITKANLSLEIDDEFMKAVEAFYKYKQEIVLHKKYDYNGHIVEYDIVPIKLYKMMMEVVWDYGEPGCLFSNRLRNYNFLEFDENYSIATTNPCVTGDTLILTKDGHVPIKDVLNQEVSIWNGYKFSTVVPHKTGENQELMEIHFSNGSKLRCTPYHKFILHSERHNNYRVEAKDLKVGDKLQKHKFPIINGSKKLYNAYAQGFFSGDGFVKIENNRKYISFYGEHKKPLAAYCLLGTCYEDSDKRTTYAVDLNFDKDFVPLNDYDIDSKLQWLAGIVDSDGGNNPDGSIGVTSINQDFLYRMMLMLETLGVSTTVSLCYPERDKRFPEGMGAKYYHCQNLYRLSISSSDVVELNKLGFCPHRIKNSAVPNRNAKRFVCVTEIINLSEKEDVYCFTENDNHSGIFNGVMTAQCGEQPLMERTACCLGSINLYEFVKNKFTKDAYFDWGEFTDAVRIAGNALDNIIDENLPRLPKEMAQYVQNAKDWRNTGLGVFNYAHTLMALQLTYGSQEALEFTDDLFSDMMSTAIGCNIERGEQKGAYPKFDKEAIKKSKIFREHYTLPNNVEEDWKFRNCTLLSIAPTGSIATMVGGSGGAEPEFALSYTRRTDNLEEQYQVESKVVQDYRKTTNNYGKLPEYFVTSADIPWKARIDTQATIQRHIDTAISSTVNLPKETKLKEIEQLYLYAWKQGLKGVTIFRDGCKRMGILTTETNNNESGDEATEKETTKLQRGTILSVSDDLIGAKRKLTTGCGSLHLETYFDELTGEPMETFINIGSSGGCERNLQLISRLMSLALRAGVPIEAIIDQCKSIKPCPAYILRTQKKGDASKGSSCPSSIGYALEELYAKIQDRCFADFDDEDVEDFEEEIAQPQIVASQAMCPECGETLTFEGGCKVCHSCGYSKCD